MGIPCEEVLSNPVDLKQEIERCLDGKGVHLIELSVKGGRRNRFLEVFVDTEEGVSLELCRQLSRDLQPLVERLMEGRDYRLTVSSPGLDRPLEHPWQFKKHIGRRLQLTVPGPDGEVLMSGTLISVSGDGVVFQTDPEGNQCMIGFSDIRLARVRTPW